MGDVKKRTLALVAEISADEIACRIIEGCLAIRRPAGLTATQALDRMPAGTLDARRAAHSVLAYIGECVRNGERPQ